jgi:hypothetical protein
MHIRLAEKEFFRKIEDLPEFNNLLSIAFYKKKDLILEVSPDGLEIFLSSKSSGESTLLLEGHWKSSYFYNSNFCEMQFLVVPYLFAIYKITLPHECIYSPGRPYRSVVDFFMRNYIYTVVRKSNVITLEVGESNNERINRASINLSKCHTWILKTLIKEPIFDNKNLHELVYACAHIEIFKFESLLLQRCIENIRKVTAKNFKDEKKYVFDLIQARTRLIHLMDQF